MCESYSYILTNSNVKHQTNQDSEPRIHIKLTNTTFSIYSKNSLLLVVLNY